MLDESLEFYYILYQVELRQQIYTLSSKFILVLMLVDVNHFTPYYVFI